jgi:hypothetical protein
MLQQVLLPTRSDSRASTRYSRHPYTTRHGPPWWSMQPVQHMCMRTMLPLSNTHWSTHAVLSLSLSHWVMHVVILLSLTCSWVSLTLGLSSSLLYWGTCAVLSLSHLGTCDVILLSCMQLGSLSHWGTRAMFSLSCMQLGGQEDAWGVAAGGGAGRSSRRRRVFPKYKSKRRCK